MKENVLTKNDGRLNGRPAKVSKLAKIGKYADFLRRPEIFQRVRGYSVLYQAVLLLEALPGEKVEKTEALMKIFDQAGTDDLLSRGFLAQAIVKVKSEKQALIAPRRSKKNEEAVTEAVIRRAKIARLMTTAAVTGLECADRPLQEGIVDILA